MPCRSWIRRVAIVAGLATLLALAPGAAAQERCLGKVATITATAGSDKIRGTRGNDVIVAGRGADRVLARAGRDLICAGDGADRAFGGPGGDRVFGGPGGDFLAGAPGNDASFGGSGVDIATFEASTGPVVADLILDSSSGPEGDDLIAQVEGLIGSRGDDTLVGDAMRNALIGGNGGDGLAGRAGRDVLAGFRGADYADGGAQRDRCSAEFRAGCERGFRFAVPERLLAWPR